MESARGAHSSLEGIIFDIGIRKQQVPTPIQIAFRGDFFVVSLAIVAVRSTEEKDSLGDDLDH